MASVRNGAAAVAACLSAAVLAVGCSGGDGDQPGTAVPGGKVAGTGYTFSLPDGWRATGNRRQLQRALAKGLSEKRDFAAIDPRGIAPDGRWQNVDDDSDPTVNVTIEPVTRDSPQAAYVASSKKLLGARAQPRELARPASLGGESGVTIAYNGPDDRDARLVIARRGDYSYALTLQAERGHSNELDALTRKVAGSWRFAEPTRQGRAQLAAIGQASGEAWTTALPPGWRATGATALRKSGLPSQVSNSESLWRGTVSSGFTTNVLVAHIEAPGADLRTLASKVAEQERIDDGRAPSYAIVSLRAGRTPDVDGEPARALDLRTRTQGMPLRQREVITLHDGELYRITLSATQDRFATDRRAFDQTMARWRWR